MARKRENGDVVDEEKFREQWQRQKVSEQDAETLFWKNKLGEIAYKKLLRFFRGVCKNPGEIRDSLLFLT